MSTRIKSAAVAVVIAIILLILHNTFIFNIAIGFVTVVALYELFRATGFEKNKNAALLCYGFAAIDSIIPAFYAHGYLYFLSYGLYFGIFVLAMCILFLREHEKFTYTDFFFMLGVTVLITYAFSSLTSMARIGKGGVFLLVITLGAAWLADSGAYFAGTFFGKTPLCPKISPKKTVEGVVGGIAANGIIMLIMCVVYKFILSGRDIHFLWIILAGMLCAIIGLIGDLTASIIKRQTNIKDYGNIMPGHGGIMDRFDSVLLVAPFMLYMYSQGLIFK